MSEEIPDLLTRQQRELLDAASESVIVNYILLWINDVRESLTLGPLGNLVPGRCGEPCHCPIANSLVCGAPAGGPIASAEVNLDSTEITKTRYQAQELDNPWFVSYFIEKFDLNQNPYTGGRFKQFLQEGLKDPQIP